jgi:MFS-type transporter involved in bile tolerance (Atg22 family)
MNLIEKDNPKVIRAWTFYDWANSVFPLVITSAIFPNFYDYVTTHDESKNYPCLFWKLHSLWRFRFRTAHT